MLRTHKVSELNEKLIGKDVEICGWIEVIREHGKLIFFELRDRYGVVQCVISKKNSKFNDFKKLTKESCVQIKGKINQRPKGTENKNISTGKVELSVEDFEIFNLCPGLPFELNEKNINEDLRLKYRFLDLRSKRMQKNILTRSKILKYVRDYFYENNFVEIETPVLAKSTPEGARDYVVPSRNFKGKFYALPQSPQLFKQLSQVAGFDRYIQMAKCFRDEDLRSDRQPEFTQVDVEMSFIEVDDIISIIEGLLKKLFKEILNIQIKTPFKRISYEEAMKKYKTDRPDLRGETGFDKDYAFCWVVDFPLFEYDKQDKKYKSMHHPFTMPNLKDFKKDKHSARSLAYDVVLNGVEIGGGSIRIHNSEIQEKVFDVLGISKKQAQEKFGFLLEALSYGAPPHGGIALGFDRLCQIILNEDSIRETITFPKNKEAKDVMLDAPSTISSRQLKEVGIELVEEKKKSSKKTKHKK